MSRKPSLLVVFLTVFIDLIGFGIVLPLLPLYADSYGATGWQLGLLMAAFSAMQFLFAPIWGRLSDRVGRRPILLVSTAGAVASYALFAIGTRFEGATALWIIIASRAFAGICGANITVAQAYIADITPAEQRSKRMGLIGMAFGLGFIFGPPLGGLSYQWFGHAGPGWTASALCAANFLLALFILVESWTPTAEHVAPRPRLEQWKHTLRQPTIGLLVIVFFLATFCFTTFELTLGLVIARNFNLGIRTPEAISVAGTLFMYCGIIGAFVQGGPIGRLVKKFGERKLIAFSLILTGLSLAPLPFIEGVGKLSWSILFSSGGKPWWLLLIALAALSVGSGLTRPPLFGLLSILTPRAEQGATIGIAQSAGSLARIFGPMFAGAFYKAHPALPYVTCAVIAVFTGVVAWMKLVGERSSERITADGDPAKNA
jgi:DHA1 family tetracycline resistance protein-like MFS transporter